VSPSALAQAPSTARPILLRAARLLDIKNGRIVKPGEILVQGDRIVEAGTSVKHPPGAEIIELGDRTLLPGLIDAQSIFFSIRRGGSADGAGVRAAADDHRHAAARDDLMAGFTPNVIWDGSAGSADTAVRNAIDEGRIPAHGCASVGTR